MFLFCVQDLTQCFNGDNIYQGVSFEVQVGEKVALIGTNGVGKTSLLKIIAGIDQPAGGKINFLIHVRCALLTQCFDALSHFTVREALEQAMPVDGSNNAVGKAVKKFGFSGRENQLVSSLSGGEKTRLQLAIVWLTDAELLLLDEPTNHLDSENLQWLERFIQEYWGTILVVSHDRNFLDNTVSRVLELQKDGITSYPGNYSAYRQAKLEQFAQNEKKYFDQEKKSRKLATAIQEQKNWADQAHSQAAKKANTLGTSKEYYQAKAKKMNRRVKSNINRLERMEEERIPRPQAKRTIDLSFTAGNRAKKAILFADGLGKTFGSREVFSNGNFALKYSEKVGLVGVNGCGKTTLLRLITGLESIDSGELWRSPSLRVGYLQQEIELLGHNRTILEEVNTICPDQGRVRNLLANLLFVGEAVFKSCNILSMGERLRVGIAKLLLGSYDLLLLDEPTNYLDIESREKLEEVLEAFGGSLIIVSHDRYLMERIPDIIWSIEDGKIQVYPGSYSDYMESRLFHQLGQ